MPYRAIRPAVDHPLVPFGLDAHSGLEEGIDRLRPRRDRNPREERRIAPGDEPERHLRPVATPRVERRDRQDCDHRGPDDREQRLVPTLRPRLEPAARPVDHRLDPRQAQPRTPEPAHPDDPDPPTRPPTPPPP